jgi:LacI family transcriptional regulator/LacI family repressor for deo operon, udp, cdd, tsx, nupC, and nupG
MLCSNKQMVLIGNWKRFFEKDYNGIFLWKWSSMAKTIHDVARVAGVGIGTVSRVLNNSAHVKPQTREKVLAAIAQLDYKPSPIARSMISKRTGSIGVIAPFFTRFFFIEVLKGMELATVRVGKDLVLYSIETNAQRDRYFSDLPMQRKVDGLLILSLTPDPAFVNGFFARGLPVVLVDAYSPALTSLVVNNIEGAHQAVKCLIEKGHQHIGFINGIIEGNFKFNQANDRLIGLHRALGEAGLLFEPEFALTAEWSRQGGKAAALQLLSQKKRPTAIFAASDIQAIGVLEAARALNISVPADLSVIGYDGIELSEMLDLSTVQQPMQYMGELAVAELMEQIESPERPPKLIRLNTILIERGTTACVPSSC